MPYGADVGGNADEVLRLTSQAVLRTKDRADVEARRFAEDIQHMTESRINRRRMGHDPDAKSAQRTEVIRNENIETGPHSRHHRKLGMACPPSSSRHV
jgi:hypothetical protein